MTSSTASQWWTWLGNTTFFLFLFYFPFLNLVFFTVRYIFFYFLFISSIATSICWPIVGFLNPSFFPLVFVKQISLNSSALLKTNTNTNKDNKETKEMTSLPPVLATVLFDFVGTEESELTLKKGEVLKVLAKYDNGWWVGETSQGLTGVFPGTYVKEELPPLGEAPPPPAPQPQPQVTPVETEKTTTTTLPSSTTPTSEIIPPLPALPPATSSSPPSPSAIFVTAKRDFTPTHPMQLAFKAGDKIQLLE